MLEISNRPRARARPILELVARLLPELYSTRSNYYCLSLTARKTPVTITSKFANDIILRGTGDSSKVFICFVDQKEWTPARMFSA